MSSSESSQELNQVRDLLFGEHARASEQRFAKIEALLSEQVERLRDTFGKSLHQLEEKNNAAHSDLRQALDEERAARDEALGAVGASLEQLEQRMNAQFARMGSESQSALKDLRAELKASTRQAKDALSRRSKELEETVNHHFSRVQEAKADRQELSHFFGEIASRMGQDISAAAAAENKSR